MDRDALYKAVRSRDRRFEGQFFVAVRTTRIYCRPGCPAPIPKPENVRFYSCAAAAEADGYRACLRCRPDAAPGSPAWRGAEATVARALRLIDEGEFSDGEAFAARLGVGARHLRRLFAEHVGASPAQVALSRRTHFARKLLDETALSITEVAAAAGFASLRRFHAHIKCAFGRTPRELRKKKIAGKKLLLRLSLRPPYDWAELAGFLAARAVPGLERVDEEGYRRGWEGGVLRVFPLDERALGLEVPSTKGLGRLVAQVRRVFDLDADPQEIAAVLGEDRLLRPSLRARPGLRVPGAWDGFELAVRAILGQQVSVAGARTLLGRLVARYGEPVLAGAEAGLTHRFPTPERVRQIDAGGFGVPRARGKALLELATRVGDGRLRLDGSAPMSETLAGLTAIPGVGPWTASYVAMRALGEPDAFPEGDLGLLRATRMNGRSLLARAEAWRPFRAYAAMHLWSLTLKERA